MLLGDVHKRRAIVRLLRDDLYELKPPLGDGTARWVSPLGWEVRFGKLPSDPSVTIFEPSGATLQRWDETPCVQEFERVLP